MKIMGLFRYLKAGLDTLSLLSRDRGCWDYEKVNLMTKCQLGHFVKVLIII